MISIDLGFTVWPSLSVSAAAVAAEYAECGENSNKHLFISGSVFSVRCHFLIEYWQLRVCDLIQMPNRYQQQLSLDLKDVGLVHLWKEAKKITLIGTFATSRNRRHVLGCCSYLTRFCVVASDYTNTFTAQMHRKAQENACSGSLPHLFASARHIFYRISFHFIPFPKL